MSRSSLRSGPDRSAANAWLARLELGGPGSAAARAAALMVPVSGAAAQRFAGRSTSHAWDLLFGFKIPNLQTILAPARQRDALNLLSGAPQGESPRRSVERLVAQLELTNWMVAAAAALLGPPLPMFAGRREQTVMLPASDLLRCGLLEDGPAIYARVALWAAQATPAINDPEPSPEAWLAWAWREIHEGVDEPGPSGAAPLAAAPRLSRSWDVSAAQALIEQICAAGEARYAEERRGAELDASWPVPPASLPGLAWQALDFSLWLRGEALIEAQHLLALCPELEGGKAVQQVSLEDESGHVTYAFAYEGPLKEQAHMAQSKLDDLIGAAWAAGLPSPPKAAGELARVGRHNFWTSPNVAFPPELRPAGAARPTRRAVNLSAQSSPWPAREDSGHRVQSWEGWMHLAQGAAPPESPADQGGTGPEQLDPDTIHPTEAWVPLGARLHSLVYDTPAPPLPRGTRAAALLRLIQHQEAWAWKPSVSGSLRSYPIPEAYAPAWTWPQPADAPGRWSGHSSNKQSSNKHSPNKQAPASDSHLQLASALVDSLRGLERGAFDQGPAAAAPRGGAAPSTTSAPSTQSDLGRAAAEKTTAEAALQMPIPKMPMWSRKREPKAPLPATPAERPRWAPAPSAGATLLLHFIPWTDQDPVRQWAQAGALWARAAEAAEVLMTLSLRSQGPDPRLDTAARLTYWRMLTRRAASCAALARRAGLLEQAQAAEAQRQGCWRLTRLEHLALSLLDTGALALLGALENEQVRQKQTNQSPQARSPQRESDDPVAGQIRMQEKRLHAWPMTLTLHDPDVEQIQIEAWCSSQGESAAHRALLGDPRIQPISELHDRQARLRLAIEERSGKGAGALYFDLRTQRWARQ